MIKKKEIQEVFDNFRNLSEEQKEVADSVKKVILLKNLYFKYNK